MNQVFSMSYWAKKGKRTNMSVTDDWFRFCFRNTIQKWLPAGTNKMLFSTRKINIPVSCDGTKKDSTHIVVLSRTSSFHHANYCQAFSKIDIIIIRTHSYRKQANRLIHPFEIRTQIENLYPYFSLSKKFLAIPP